MLKEAFLKKKPSQKCEWQKISPEFKEPKALELMLKEAFFKGKPRFKLGSASKVFGRQLNYPCENEYRPILYQLKMVCKGHCIHRPEIICRWI